MSEHYQYNTRLAEEMANWYHADAPWETGFISIMRAMAAKTPQLPPPAKAELPVYESFRLGQGAYMAFPPREVSRVSWQDDKLKLQLFGLGVWGPQGAMPLHLTEFAHARGELRDHTLTDFVDIFHHRLLSQFYRAWFVAQDTASLDRLHDEHFSFYIGSLIGLDPQEITDSCLPTHARLASAAHLIREARNPEGLLGALHYYFEIPVRIEEFTPRWIFLDKYEQSQMGNNDCALSLGDGAILGNAVMDRQHNFQLILGPLTLQRYMHFSPWGEDLPILREWVRNFIGYEYAWEVQLVLSADEVPQATLDGSHQLGYATWLERHTVVSQVTGMSFAPEMYQHGQP